MVSRQAGEKAFKFFLGFNGQKASRLCHLRVTEHFPQGLSVLPLHQAEGEAVRMQLSIFHSNHSGLPFSAKLAADVFNL